jgi:predicted nucleic acid-binding protein
MRKLKLYLETTVFNYYFDEERDGHADTVQLFEAIGARKYDAYTSAYVVAELEVAAEPKRTAMLSLIERFGIRELPTSDEVTRLAQLYVQNGIIPVRYTLDATHVACASANELDCVLSYNFTHINRVKTKLLTDRLNNENGYKSVVICTSKEVLDDEKD